MLGGAAGILLAYAGLGTLLRLAPSDLPRLNEVRMDGIALMFAVAASLFSGVLFGILPALRIAGQDPQEALKSGSYTNTESSRACGCARLWWPPRSVSARFFSSPPDC